MLTTTNNQTQPLNMTSEMVKSVWVSIGHFLLHLDPDIRKIIRLEHLHLKILKRKYSRLQ